jgi:hypothetical protein
MNTRTFFAAAALAAGAMIAPVASQAATFTWGFADTSFTVRPGETVEIEATVTLSDPASLPITLGADVVSAGFGFTPVAGLTPSEGPAGPLTFPTQFDGVTLTAGTPFAFVFANVVADASAPLGSVLVLTNPAFGLDGTNVILRGTDITVTVTPIPAALPLLATALGGVALLARRRRA